MWITISKIGAYMTAPLSMVLVCLAFALLLYLFGCRKLAKTFGILGLGTLLIASSPPVARMLTISLESQYPVRAVETYEAVETIVILGGSINMPLQNRLEVELGEASDRVLYGMRLYRAGKGKRIFLTGGNVDTELWKQSEASLVSRLLQEWGVPEEAIEYEGESKTTRENAILTHDYLKQEDRLDQPILLVTSASHMPRSVAAFQAVGIKVIPAVTDVSVVGVRSDGLASWLPSTGALGATTRAMHEYVGLWFYRLKEWV